MTSKAGRVSPKPWNVLDAVKIKPCATKFHELICRNTIAIAVPIARIVSGAKSASTVVASVVDSGDV